MKIRKIAVVTGSRADYGHLYWLMKAIQNDHALELQLIVAGMHLSSEYGMTSETIVEDGFTINDKIEMLLSSDTSSAITKSVGLGIIGFADSLARLRPNILVVLGDRFEILAAVQAALIAKIPVAHLHGGEATYGAFDESIRNAITKMSHIHFPAAPEYAEKIIQMGEDPKSVYNYGPPGIDYIAKVKLLNRQALEEAMGFALGTKNILITYHPTTLSKNGEKHGINQLLEALQTLESIKDYKLIFTMPNADPHGKKIQIAIKDYVSSNQGRAICFESLGQLRYFSAISHVDLVLGNSSSGLNEVPYFNKPTVNIGTRQEGRLYPDTVIHSEEDAASIRAAIKEALLLNLSPELRHPGLHKNAGNISMMIKDTLKEIDLNTILVKRFYQRPEG